MLDEGLISRELSVEFETDRLDVVVSDGGDAQEVVRAFAGVWGGDDGPGTRARRSTNDKKQRYESSNDDSFHRYGIFRQLPDRASISS